MKQFLLVIVLLVSAGIAQAQQNPTTLSSPMRSQPTPQVRIQPKSPLNQDNQNVEQAINETMKETSKDATKDMNDALKEMERTKEKKKLLRERNERMKNDTAKLKQEVKEHYKNSNRQNAMPQYGTSVRPLSSSAPPQIKQGAPLSLPPSPAGQPRR